MTIRRALLLAFVLVGLVPALALALLAFERARGALAGEIERGLAGQADAVLAELTQLMVERLHNADTWRRIEVLQDLQVGDVDKRLAGFLQRLQRGHGGIYRELSACDASGRVVASSDAARIGRPAPAPRPWRAVTVGDSRIALDAPGVLDDADPGPVVTLRTSVGSAFGAGGAIGELLLHVDWRAIDRRLEQAAAGGRMAALLDADGRVVAGSAALLAAVPRLGDALAPWWRAASAMPAGPVQIGALAAQGPLLAGLARERVQPGASGLDWSLVLLVPRDEALAPVRQMAMVFAALLAAVALATVAVALGISRSIARPVVVLTDYIRSWRGGRALPPPPAAAGEVGELGRAFAQMVHESEQSQQQLARATALAAVGEMSAVIAHEVRTPLGVMLSSAQIVQREPNLSDEGRELLSHLESETARLARLIATMLEGARPREPQLEPTEMRELVEHAAALLSAQAARQQVRIETRLPQVPMELDCDPEQMTQVLLNLLLNGLQILPQGGRIELALRDEADALVIDIADDGPGIAPEARSRIFEAFFFQREGGIGLGLAVVQRIVSAHGGRIEAGQSDLGGALFRIRLPRAAAGSTRRYDS